MEETTTDAATQDPGVNATQPDEQPAEAVTTPDSEPQQPEQEEDSTDAPAEADNAEDDLTDYWAKKGIDISTPEGQIKAAKSYREAERAMHSKSQEASELKKSITAQPATNEDDRVAKLELALAINDWKADVGVTRSQDIAMGDYLTQNPQKMEALMSGALDFNDILALSGVQKSADPRTLKKQGGTEALQQLANKQRATAPRGAASQPSAPAKSDPIMDVLLAD